ASLLALLLQSLFESAQLLAERRDLVAQRVGVRGLAPLLRSGLGRRRRSLQPSRSPRPLAKDAIGLALARQDPLEARLERLLDEILPGLTVLDQLVQERRRQSRAVVALVLEDDL